MEKIEEELVKAYIELKDLNYELRQQNLELSRLLEKNLEEKKEEPQIEPKKKRRKKNKAAQFIYTRLAQLRKENPNLTKKLAYRMALGEYKQQKTTL